MHVKDFAEAMKNLPARFSNLTFWRECRKLKDSVVDALNYLNEWGIGIENELSGKLPKSPSDWENWTADEQETARAKIGAEKALGAWEDIATVTIEEPVTSFTVDNDGNGNPFQLSHVVLECVIPPEEQATQRNISFANSKNISAFDSFSRIPITTSTSVPKVVITYAHIVSDRIICESSVSNNYDNRYQISQVCAIFNGYGGVIARSLDSICVFTYDNPFPVGTQLIMRGIRK